MLESVIVPNQNSSAPDAVTGTLIPATDMTEAHMRILVDISMPVEPFNARVKDGTAGQILQSILAELKPEAVYFTERDGKRGGTIVLDVADASKLPSIGEPFFLHFNASVSFHPCLTPEDLGKAGLDEIGKKYR